MPSSSYGDSVFINCPFDSGFTSLFRAIHFAVQDCGFVSRCALETDDATETRISKIERIIEDCRFGIHDISRIEVDQVSGLPRFNMPLELGLFLGAKRFGNARQRSKMCLVLDRDPFRYQQFCSDIAGQQVRSHGDDPELAIRRVRDWLRDADSGNQLPGGASIAQRHKLFLADLPLYCDTFRLREDELTFNDLTSLIAEWLKANRS
jgi:hypothetical protein